MIRKLVQSLEDPKKPLLGPNYRFLRKIGLILPENKLGKIGYIFLNELVTFFVITQYMEIYNVRSDLDLLLQNMKISMLSIVCVVKSNNYVFYQKQWKEVIEYVTEADRYERDTRDTTRGKIIDRYTKYCRTLTYFYWVLVFITFITVTHTPLIQFVSSATFRGDLRNGTVPFPHIFSSWMPIDKNHAPGSWITVLWHASTCGYGACIMGAFDTTAVAIMVFFGGKLEIMRERSKQMFGSGATGISDIEAFKRIRQLHEMHTLMKKYSLLFNSVLSPIMFLYVVMCSLMLCASAYQLTSATDATQKLLMAEYFVFGIAQLFMYCWHSQDVLVKSQDLIYGPYESEWWAATNHHRKAVVLLIGQFRIQHIFKAGPFTDLTLSTFITILKGAYSYYTLIKK